MRDDYDGYDPNGVGIANGNFVGLPRVAKPLIRLYTLPYAPALSYGTGAEGGPARILAASYQLDVCLRGLNRPWELGFDWQADPFQVNELHHALAPRAAAIIARLETGGGLTDEHKASYTALEQSGRELSTRVQDEVAAGLMSGVFPVLVGGDHSTPLGAYLALPPDTAVLQLDAHMDLRQAYEGFVHSHASVMYNLLQGTGSTRLVQFGIRDYCPAELSLSIADDRVTTFFAADIHAARLEGEAYAKTIAPVIEALPSRVWLSLDVDVLEVSLCTHTGTPVPGGMSFAEVTYFVRAVLASGRQIIGMDLVETGDHPHDANVSARLIYEIASRSVYTTLGD